MRASTTELENIWQKGKINVQDFKDFLYSQGYVDNDVTLSFQQLGVLFVRYGNEYADFAGLDFADGNDDNDWNN